MVLTKCYKTNVVVDIHSPHRDDTACIIPGTDDKYGKVLADRQTVLPADFPIFSPEEVITKGESDIYLMHGVIVTVVDLFTSSY